MRVFRDNVWCQVAEEDPRELDWLNDYLSFNNPSAYFQGRSDSWERMFRMIDRIFPSGFFPMVLKAAKEAGFRFDYDDRRSRPTSVNQAADLSWLRDYQLAAVRRVWQKDRGIVKVPTGGGKTEIAIALAESLPCRWLFLVHRQTLLQQTAERYQQRTGKPAGVVGGGKKAPACAGFTVMTFQTAWSGIKRGDEGVLGLLHEAEGLIVDECHVQGAVSFLAVTEKADSAFYRVGLSGTPLDRGDKRGVLAVGSLGPVIYSIDPQVLISARVLALPKIHFVPVLNSYEYDVESSPNPSWQHIYQTTYRRCVIDSPTRNRAVVDAAKRAARPALVFVKEIDHGKLLRKMLTKAGVKAEFTWGTHSTERRRAAVQRLVRGDVEVLVCSVIFQEGVDIPSLASVVVASGERSAVAALQRVGRGMRTDNGRKAEFEVWEFLDLGNKIIEKQAKARMRAYEAADYSVTVEAEPEPARLPLG